MWKQDAALRTEHLQLLRTRALSATRLLTVAALVALGGGTSCGGIGECEPGSGDTCQVRGFVVVGPEVWAFQRCGSGVLISVNVKGYEPGFEKLDDALHESMGCAEVAADTWTCLRQDATVYVEMTATISAPGHYGHSSKYERELEIVAIHDASSVGPGDCSRLDPIFP